MEPTAPRSTRSTRGPSPGLSVKVSLADVVGALELASDETSSYIQRSTGRVVMFVHEDMRFAELSEEDDVSRLPDWQREAVAQAREVLASGDWLLLPGRFDVHEWQIMDDFVRALPDPIARDRLADAIRGRGAFRHFKGTIRQLGLEKAWYAHRAETLEGLAREWLAEHGFEVASGPA